MSSALLRYLASRGQLLLLALMLPASLIAQTSINSINSLPEPFEPERERNVAFTVVGTAGLTGLELHIFDETQNNLLQTGLGLSETATAGTYTVEWNGYAQSTYQPTGTYYARVYNLVTTTYVGPFQDFTIARMVDSIEVDPTPFIPNGTSEVTFRVTGRPGATDLQAYFNFGGGRFFTLTETGPDTGIYEGRSNLVLDGYRYPTNSNFNIQVRTTDNRRSFFSGSLQVRHFSAFGADRNEYYPTQGDTVTFTAQGEAGLNPYVQVRLADDPFNGMYYQRRDHVMAAVPGAGSHGWVYATGEVGEDDASARWIEGAPINENGTPGAWQRVVQMPLGLESPAIATQGNTIYILGGIQNGNRDEIYRAEVASDGSIAEVTTEAVRMPVPLYEHEAVIAGDYLYIVGGYYQERRCWVAPISSDGTVGTFTETSSLLTGRGKFGLAAHNGHLYAVGGYTAETSVERAAINGLDGTLGTWEVAGTLVQRRRALEAVVSEGRLIVVGGYDGSTGTYLRQIESAVINGDGSLGNFVAASQTLLMDRARMGSAVLGNTVYLSGGNQAGAGRRASVEWFSLDGAGEHDFGPGANRFGNVAMTEDPAGTYVGTWNLRDDADNDIPRATNYLGWLRDSGNDYSFERTDGFSVEVSVGSVVATPNPFTPDGTNEVTITVESDPGQRGLTYEVDAQRRDLTEISPGVYQATYNFVRDGLISTPGNYTIYVRDENGIYSSVTGPLTVSHFGGVNVSAGSFAPTAGETVTFSASGVTTQTAELLLTRAGWGTSGYTNPRQYINWGFVMVNGRLYVTGGDSSTSYRTVESSGVEPDGSLTSWRREADMGEQRLYHAAAATSTTLYVLGSGGNRSSVEFARLGEDGRLGEWQLTSPLPVNRGYAPALVRGEYIYIFGGYSQNQNIIYRAAINEDGSLEPWQSFGTLPRNLYGHQAVMVGDRLYLLGGYNGAYLTNVYVAEFQPDDTLIGWTELEPMNNQRYRFGAVAVNGYLFAFGSADNQNGRDTMERAQILGDGTLGPWELLPDAPPISGALAVTEANGWIYLTGGDSDSIPVLRAQVAGDGTLGAFQGDLWGLLPLVEDPPGSYSVVWDGRDSLGRTVPSGDYTAVLRNSTSGLTYRSRSRGVEVRDVLSTFEIIPDFFVPDGNNTVTLRATGTPGQVGVYTSWFEQMILDEVSPGVYEHEFDFVRNNQVQNESAPTLTLYYPSGTSTGLSDSVTIRHVRNFRTEPSNFTPLADGSSLSTFRVDGEPGQDLRATLSSSDGRALGLLERRQYISNSTVYQDGRVYLLGGQTRDSYSDSGEMIEFAADGSTLRPRNLQTLPAARSYASAAAYDGWLYFGGGLPNQNTAGRIIYRAPILADGTTGPWIEEANQLVRGRYGAEMVANNGWLYVIGGYDGQYRSEIERAPINPDGSLGEWIEDQNAPIRTYAGQTHVVDGQLYIFGGYPDTRKVRRAPFNSDGTLGTWEELPDMIYDRYLHAVAVAGNRFYALGSDYTSNYHTVEMAELDGDGNLGSWQRVEDLYTYARYAGAAAHNGFLYVFGGSNGFASPSRGIFRAQINPDGSLGEWMWPSLPSGTMTPEGDGTTYAIGWDGRDTEGKVVSLGAYTWTLTNAVSGVGYPGNRNVSVDADIEPPTVDPPLLIADGMNELTFEFDGFPGVSGFYGHFSKSDIDSSRFNGRSFEFSEVGEGVYQLIWNGVAQNQSNQRRIYPDGIYTLTVYEPDGSPASNELTFEIQGIGAINRPDEFTPGGGATIPIQLQGPAGLEPVVQIFNNQTGFFVREIAAAPTQDGYLAPWDGRDENGDFTGPNTYRVRVYSDAVSPREQYSLESTFLVRQGVFGIEITPNPFQPTGSNVASVLIEADPGQTGLTAEFSHPFGPVRTGVEMTETTTPGRYTGEWDGRDDDGNLMPDGVVTVAIRNGSGELFPLSGSVTLSTITRFAVAPSPFTPRADSAVTVEVDMTPGRTLEANFGALKTISLAEGPTGTYVGSWDVRLENGDFAPPGVYTVTLNDSELGILNQSRAFQVNEVDLTPPRATILWASPAPPIGVGTSNFTLQATERLSGPPTFSVTPPNSGTPIAATFEASLDNGLNWPGSIILPPGVLNGQAVMTWEGTDRAQNTGTGFQGTDRVFIDTLGPVATSIQINPSNDGVLGTGGKQVNIYFNESVAAPPALAFTPPQGEPITVALSGGGTSWTGSLTISQAMGDGLGTFTVTAIDLVGNSGSSISNGAEWTLDFVAPGAPAPLTAAAEPAGRVRLDWIAATGQPYNYQLWRVQGQGGNPLQGTLLNGSLFANSYTDTPPSEGNWTYAVTATDRGGNTSVPSNAVVANADATAPGAPTNAVAAAVGGDAQITWDAPAGEQPTSYNLYYRAGDQPITSTSGVQRLLSGIQTRTASVAANPIGDQHFAVTAQDAAGNESPVSNSAAFFFESPLPAPGSLAIAFDPDRGALLSWPAVAGPNVAGYTVSRNGAILTPTPITTRTFTDPNAPVATTAVYSVRGVTDAGTPGSAVSGTVKPLVPEIASDNLTIEPQLLVPFDVTLGNPAADGVELTSLRVELLDANDSVLQTVMGTAPGALAGGESTEQRLIGGLTTYPATAQVVAGLQAEEGNVTLTAVRRYPVVIRPGGIRVEVFAEPLVRGVPASVRLRFSNPSTLPIDIVTAVGDDPSPDVYAELLDDSGARLAMASLNQRGGGVFNTPGYAKIVLQPGESFLTEPITPVVPLDAPDTIYVRGGTSQTYYNYGLSGAVSGPGMTSDAVPSNPTETPYRGIVQADAELYGQGSLVTFTGQALSNLDDSPVPNVTVRIGLDVKGFPRFFSALTDGDGNFTYEFLPFTNEYGLYTAWAVHPEVQDRPAQDTFHIGGISVPTPVNLRMAKNSTLEFDFDITNSSELRMTDVEVTWTPTMDADDLVVEVTLPATEISAEGRLRARVKVMVPIDAASEAAGELRVTSAEGFLATAVVALELRPAQPIVRVSPGFIERTLEQGGSYSTEVVIQNIGFDTLRNARMEAPSVPWITYSVRNPNLGNIPPSGSRRVGVVITPPPDLEPGIYTEQFTLAADNSSDLTWNVFMTLTSSETGSIAFQVEDVLTETLEGAEIEVGSVYTSELYFTGVSGPDGTFLLEDIPVGEYNFRVTAPGHEAKVGSVEVLPGQTIPIRAFLANVFVTVSWEVVPVVIEDRYEIVLETTFETHVPAPVLIANPPSLTHRMTRPGVSNALFSVTNRGLIAGNDFRVTPSTASPGMRIELLVDLVETILPMQTIEIPYRVVLDPTAQPDTSPKLMADAAPLPGMPEKSIFGMRASDIQREIAIQDDIPINPADCGLSGQLLAILNYICRLESLATGADHRVKPEVAASAVALGGVLDSASVVCSPTGCNNCCLAIANCSGQFFSPGSLGPGGCILAAAQCLAETLGLGGGGSGGMSIGGGGPGGGGGTGPGGGGYGGIGWSPCAPTGK